MKLYTKTGDGGMTGMIGGRVRKDDARVEACGTIDELNSLVGLAIQSAVLDGRYADLAGRLTDIQHELFDCGSDLSHMIPGDRPYKVTPEMVEALEADIDRLHAEAPPIRRFILPGGTPLAAWLHACRTVCRRAERRTVSLAGVAETNREVLRYLNRLSDYFFAAARSANARAGVPDTEYARGAGVFRLEDPS
jgi:cob(I)alamin adenosyltransferase